MIATFFLLQLNLLMKRLSFVIALLFFSAFSFAQVNDTANYFPPPPPDNNSAVSNVLRSQKHLLFIDITQNTWLHLPDDITTKFISGGFNISIFYDFFIAKKFFGIAPGISFSNVTVKSNAIPVEDPSALPEGFTNMQVVSDTPLHYVKNKISTSYLDLPIEFRFRIKPDVRGKNFWIAPGFRAGFLLSDFWKKKIDSPNSSKEKIYNIQFIEKFHYGVSLRAGYYKFGGYVFYSLTDLFEKNRGTYLTPFSVGITLTPL